MPQSLKKWKPSIILRSLFLPTLFSENAKPSLATITLIPGHSSACIKEILITLPEVELHLEIYIQLMFIHNLAIRLLAEISQVKYLSLSISLYMFSMVIFWIIKLTIAYSIDWSFVWSRNKRSYARNFSCFRGQWLVNWNLCRCINSLKMCVWSYKRQKKACSW